MPIPDPPDYDHGSTGSQPANPIDYENGDPLDEAELDYYLNTEFTKFDQIIEALEEIRDGVITVASATDASNVTGTYKGNDIDSDGDGSVDSADSATLVKNNDIDSNGDGTVDAADTAAAVKGNDIDSDADGRVDAADTAKLVKGNDIDSNGDGRVDDADQVQGINIFHDAIFASESGIINSGNAATVTQTELADGDRLRVYKAGFNKPGGQAAPSGLDLIVASFGSSGAGREGIILSGDGATLYSKETGTPYFQYENTSGETQHIEIMIDNGHFGSGTGSNEKASAVITARVE